MNKLTLPLLALTACTQVNDSEVPITKRQDCIIEMARVKSACSNASVIGTNPNQPLYDARDALKECLGDVKVICSDTGFSKILTIEQL